MFQSVIDDLVRICVPSTSINGMTAVVSDVPVAANSLSFLTETTSQKAHAFVMLKDILRIVTGKHQSYH